MIVSTRKKTILRQLLFFSKTHSVIVNRIDVKNQIINNMVFNVGQRISVYLKV